MSEQSEYLTQVYAANERENDAITEATKDYRAAMAGFLAGRYAYWTQVEGASDDAAQRAVLDELENHLFALANPITYQFAVTPKIEYLTGETLAGPR